MRNVIINFKLLDMNILVILTLGKNTTTRGSTVETLSFYVFSSVRCQ